MLYKNHISIFLKVLALTMIPVILLLILIIVANGKTYDIQLSKTKYDKKYLFFSLDDVHDCILRLSKYERKSIFNDPTLSILKYWHEKYGIVVSLYVQGNFTINSNYKDELSRNSSWLKFAYHGQNEWHGFRIDFINFYKQVKDSIKDVSIVDPIPRIDRFHANYVTCKLLQSMGGVKGFLTCDDWAYNSIKRETCYYLTDEQLRILDKHNRMSDLDNNLLFIKSDFRLEQIEDRWGNVQQCLNYYSQSDEANELVIFSHEWNLLNYIEQADSIFKWAKENNYNFEFPINICQK